VVTNTAITVRTVSIFIQIFLVGSVKYFSERAHLAVHGYPRSLILVRIESY